jgi:hypothetical protein
MPPLFAAAIYTDTRGVAAAGTSSDLCRLSRAYAAVNSAPYKRITADTYTQIKNTTTAAIDPWTLKRLRSRT